MYLIYDLCNKIFLKWMNILTLNDQNSFDGPFKWWNPPNKKILSDPSLFGHQTTELCWVLFGNSPKHLIFSNFLELGSKNQRAHSSDCSEISPPKRRRPFEIAMNWAPRRRPGILFKLIKFHWFKSGRYCQKSPSPRPKY